MRDTYMYLKRSFNSHTDGELNFSSIDVPLLSTTTVSILARFLVVQSIFLFYDESQTDNLGSAVRKSLLFC